MVGAVARVSLGDWLKVLVVTVGCIVFLATDAANGKRDAELTLANQTAIAETRSDVVALRLETQGNAANIERTTRILEALLDRVREHDIEGAGREVEIKHNAAEIERIRGGTD